MATTTTLSLSLFLLLSLLTVSSAHNITELLSSNPNYSLYANLLLKTKVADEINTRQTITVLVLNNTVFNSTLKYQPLSALKVLVSIHVLLDYYDSTKLHNLPQLSTITTTLHQTSGIAYASDGFVNITTDSSKDRVFFATASEGSRPISQLTKSVKSIPYNISVIEVSAPIDVAGLLSPPWPNDVNVTAILLNAGCKKFAALINDMKVINEYDGVRAKGITVFAPSDEAWKKSQGMPDWTKLTENDTKTVLRYHAAAGYYPLATLKVRKNPVITLAREGGLAYGIIPEGSRDSVLLKSGVDSARIVNTIGESIPVVVYLIDNVLLPVELFGSNKSLISPIGSPLPLPLAPLVPTLPSPKQQPGVPVPASGPAVPMPPSKGHRESPAEGPGASEPMSDEGTGTKSGATHGYCGMFAAKVIIVSLLVFSMF